MYKHIYLYLTKHANMQVYSAEVNPDVILSETGHSQRDVCLCTLPGPLHWATIELIF
jgi:hypothetical protein